MELQPGYPFMVYGNMAWNFLLIAALAYMVRLWMGTIETKLLSFCKVTKDDNACILIKIEQLQKEVSGKTTNAEHKEVQMELGEYGDRILKLELQVRVIEERK